MRPVEENGSLDPLSKAMGRVRLQTGLSRAQQMPNAKGRIGRVGREI